MDGQRVNVSTADDVQRSLLVRRAVSSRALPAGRTHMNEFMLGYLDSMRLLWPCLVLAGSLVCLWHAIVTVTAGPAAAISSVL